LFIKINEVNNSKIFHRDGSENTLRLTKKRLDCKTRGPNDYNVDFITEPKTSFRTPLIKW